MQYYDDFSAYPAGALPAGLTAKLDKQAAWSVVDDPDHGKVLRNNETVANDAGRRAVVFDAVPAADEGEVYIEVATYEGAVIYDAKVALCLSADPAKNVDGATAELYVAGYRQAKNQIIDYKSGAGNIGVDNATTSPGATPATEIWCVRGRVRRDSATAKTISCKFWKKTDGEPASFEETYTDSNSPLGAGLFGLFVFFQRTTKFVAIGIGTGTDAAPTAPVQTATTTKGIRETLYNGSTPLANLTGLTAVVIDQSPVTAGNPSCQAFAGSTNAAGEIVMDIDSFTSQAVGGKCWLVVKQYNATTPQDTLVWSGEVDIKNIA